MTKQQSLFNTDPAPWELDSQSNRPVASIVFAEGPPGPFDYAIPDRLLGQVEPGRRVVVPLGGGNRRVTGYCIEVASGNPGRQRTLKEVLEVLDPIPLVSGQLLKVARWMAEHYLCSLGTALEAVVPSGVRHRSGTRDTLFLRVKPEIAAKIDELKLPPKQAAALRALAAATQPMTPQELCEAAGCTEGPIRQLRQHGLIEAQTQRVYRSMRESPLPRQQQHDLHADQQTALDSILQAVRSGEGGEILLHGVTGSGKTEVYIRAIEEVVSYGRQAIVLVPEISLTPQTRQRFRSRFDRVAVLHSHQSPVERHGHWQAIARGEVEVVVGARSAIFAPVPHLGLIVVDEEHDSSFKQDSAPRYHARDVARFRSATEHVPLVLGSATPSLESWFRGREGKSKIMELPLRVLDRPLPEVGVIDLRNDFRNPMMRGAISRPLVQAMEDSLKTGGQVILLLNRRGFSTQIQCPACGEVVKCESCDIALTHHLDSQKAVCHYCDYQRPAPQQCPKCNSPGIRYRGLGTQRLEAEVRARFPKTEVVRMDSDTMKKPGSHEEALERFRAGHIRILLGTQMIAKGLDFPNVTLVGVINADTSLHLPDFRAAERTFQLVTQVAGRTGRGEKGGRVLVQTFSPDHYAIRAAMKHDFGYFADQELPLRRQFGYPPWGSMGRIVVRGPVEKIAEAYAKTIGDGLKKGMEEEKVSLRVLGPTAAPIARLRDNFRFHMLLLASNGDELRRVIQKGTAGIEPPQEVQWIVDIDPYDML